MKTPVQDFEVLPAEKPGSPDDFARLLAFVLDDLIPIPGTKYRVGLDPIIGLIPGLGDTSMTAVSSLILVQALRAGVPRVTIARMAVNVLINAIGGALPGLGDIFSAWFKSNQRNYGLLQKHALGSRRSTAADWAFLIAILIVIGVVVATMALAAAFLAYRMLALLFGSA